MTDKEMALALGDYIIKLQLEKRALEGAFLEYRISTPEGRREIPFRQVAARIAQEEGLQEIASQQRHGLLQEVATGTPDSALIRGLYRQFLEE
jgi:hypothetical protein